MRSIVPATADRPSVKAPIGCPLGDVISRRGATVLGETGAIAPSPPLSHSGTELRLRRLAVLSDVEWDAAVLMTGRAFRFSHRAAAGRALEHASASYRYIPTLAEFDDGTSILCPLVRVKRRPASLSMALGMPLGMEGTPLAIAGQPRPVRSSRTSRRYLTSAADSTHSGPTRSPQRHATRAGKPTAAASRSSVRLPRT
jgi:hypothetical protein